MEHLLSFQASDTMNDPLRHELLKRINLSPLMADKWSSPGLSLPTHFCKDDFTGDVPIDETQFQDPNFGRSPANACLPGIWLHKIEVAIIFGEIQELNLQVFRHRLDQSTTDERVRTLDISLTKWRNDLPVSRRLGMSNIEAHRSQGQGATFLDLHLGYNHYCVLLFFQYLSRPSKDNQGMHVYAERCKEHALMYSSLLKMSREMEDCRTVHATVGHMTVVSSSVLLYFLLTDGAVSTEDASILRESLLSNFETIVELEKYWPRQTQWVNEVQRNSIHSQANE